MRCLSVIWCDQKPDKGDRNNGSRAIVRWGRETADVSSNLEVRYQDASFDEQVQLRDYNCEIWLIKPWIATPALV